MGGRLHLEMNTGTMTPWCDWEGEADVPAAGGPAVGLAGHTPTERGVAESCRPAPAPALPQRPREAPTRVRVSCAPSKLPALSWEAD